MGESRTEDTGRVRQEAELATRLDDVDLVRAYAERLIADGEPLGQCIVASLAGESPSYADCFPGAIVGFKRGHVHLGRRNGIPREVTIVGWDWRERANKALVSILESPAARFLDRVRIDLANLKDEPPEELLGLLEGAKRLPALTGLFLGHPLPDAMMGPELEARFRALFPALDPVHPLESRHSRAALIRIDGARRQATPLPIYLRPPYASDDDVRLDEEYFVFIDDLIFVRCPQAIDLRLNKRDVHVPARGIFMLGPGDRVVFPRKPPGYGGTYEVVGLPPGATDPPYSTVWAARRDRPK
jgi:hypothetical protein